MARISTMSCCKLETVTIVFATILSVIYATIACAGMTGLVYLTGCIVLGIFTSDYYELFGFLAVILNFSTVSFLFCILLIRGIKKRNGKMVRAYFIYGCFVTIVAVLLTVGEYIWFYGQDPEITIAMVSITLYHSVLLVLVMMTYLKFQSATAIRSSDRLHLMNNQQLFLNQKDRLALIS